jgi:hypothetical protein
MIWIAPPEKDTANDEAWHLAAAIQFHGVADLN